MYGIILLSSQLERHCQALGLVYWVSYDRLAAISTHIKASSKQNDESLTSDFAVCHVTVTLTQATV